MTGTWEYFALPQVIESTSEMPFLPDSPLWASCPENRSVGLFPFLERRGGTGIPFALPFQSDFHTERRSLTQMILALECARDLRIAESPLENVKHPCGSTCWVLVRKHDARAQFCGEG